MRIFPGVISGTFLLVLMLLSGCGSDAERHVTQLADNTGGKVMEQATFAGGCFWCMEAPFEKLDGVANVVSGYMGGSGKNPTYDDYADKGHVEAVQITYEPSQITYSELLEVFWRQIDPTDAGGQFVDRARNTGRRSYTTTTNRNGWLKNQNKHLRHPEDMRAESRPTSSKLPLSMKRRSITRITTRRTRFDTSSTGPGPVATRI